MPVVSIFLKRLLDETATDAVADLTFELFRAFKNKKSKVIGVERRCYLLTESLDAEKDQNEKLKEQVEAVKFSVKAKEQKLNSTENFLVADLGAGLTSSLITDYVYNCQDILNHSFCLTYLSRREPGWLCYKTGKASPGIRPFKIGQRVVPTHRRTKVRAAILPVSGDADG